VAGTTPVRDRAATTPAANVFSPDQIVTIALTIRGVPADYTEAVVKRLLIASLSGSGSTSGVRSLSVGRESADARTGTLVVKGDLARDLKIAGNSLTCNGSECSVEIELTEWIVYLAAMPNVTQNISAVKIYPALQLQLQGQTAVQFFNSMGVNGVSLPALRKEGERQPHIKFYASQGTVIRLEGPSNVKASELVLPARAQFHELILVNQGSSRWALELLSNEGVTPISGLPPAETAPGAPRAAPNVPPQKTYYVLEARSMVNWSAEQVAQGMRRFLEQRNIRATISINGQAVPGDQRLDLIGKKLVLWAGEVPRNSRAEVQIPDFPAPIQFAPPEPAGVGEGPIRATDLVARATPIFPASQLSDRWQVNVTAVNRISGRDDPIQLSELCDFALTSQSVAGRTVLASLTQEGGILRSATKVETPRLAGEAAQLEVTVTPKPGLAPCSQQSVPLHSPSYRLGNNAVPTMSAGVTIAARGRWFLALYAPQGIGAGMSDVAVRSVFEARNQIADSMIEYLDRQREVRFPITAPAQAALGFDLALVSNADAFSAEQPFEEGSVITGQYRRSSTSRFRLDREGQQRLDAFLNGLRGSGSAPSFDALEQTINRYARLFGDRERRYNDFPPIVFYVGAGAPTRDSCQQWKTMVDHVKPVRVFALEFVSAPAVRIRDDLGPTGQAEGAETRTLGYSCRDKENGSVLLFVPFPDLIARSPDLVLADIFRQMDLWFSRGDRVDDN
jgi:hypothetical protein